MNQFDEKSVLSDLPAQLRKDIFDNLYTGALQDVPIFAGCSSQFMTEISLRMSPISFPQFQNVYCQGELGTKMYFITKGSVALILREVMGQPNQDDFIQLADSCVELCRGSFFGEAAVLGHPSRLETIVTTRSSTMMTSACMTCRTCVSCRLSSRRSSVSSRSSGCGETERRARLWSTAREFGLDPDDFVAGTERADDGEDPHVPRSISTRYNGATRQVVFVEGWKTLVVDRVCNSMVATLPKIFHSLRRVGANVRRWPTSCTRWTGGASGSGSPSSGETLNLKTESQSPRFSGSAGRTAELAQPSSRVSGEDITSAPPRWRTRWRRSSNS